MLPQVLATPVMILVMENAALNAIKPFLDAGESAVGIAVDVKHLAATPVGHEVRATAEVVGVDGKRIDFKVSASDGKEEIGKGSHQRIVIDLRSFNERLAKKSRALAQRPAHSPPMRAPFSATERFISSTTNASASVTTAKIQKQSK